MNIVFLRNIELRCGIYCHFLDTADKFQRQITFKIDREVVFNVVDQFSGA